MIIDLPPQQPVIAWHQIVEECLQNDHLTADVRVSSNSVTINTPPTLLQQACTLVKNNKKPHFVSKKTTLDNAGEALKFYFSTAVNQLADEKGITDQNSTFSQEAHTALNSLEQELKYYKSPLNKPTSQIIQYLDREALKALFFLKENLAHPSFDPTNPNNTSNNVDIAALPKTLVLSGGGMKGIGYVGAYKVLTEAGLLSQLNLVAGSSIGASTAAFIAAGMTPKMLQETSDETDYERLLTGHSSNPVISDSTFLNKMGYFDGTYAMDIVNQNLLLPITLFFRDLSLTDLQNQIDTLKENSSLTADDETLILNLRNSLLNPANQVPKTDNTSLSEDVLQADAPVFITFQDLDVLHKLKPSLFKSLTVTGFNKTKGVEVYFNVQNTPLMRIADALRISMSLPGIFQPVQDSQGDILEDGGIGSNTPSEVSNDPSTTLVCYFDPAGATSPLVLWCEETLSGNAQLKYDEKQDAKKIAAAGPNALDVYYGDLSTASFFASLEEIHAAELQAEVRMWEQLIARQ